ncbi:hypothetical protein GCM10023192_27630 [Amycolatopsis samaneae]
MTSCGSTPASRARVTTCFAKRAGSCCAEAAAEDDDAVGVGVGAALLEGGAAFGVAASHPARTNAADTSTHRTAFTTASLSEAV